MLEPDGANLGSVLKHLIQGQPSEWKMLQQYLKRIYPGFGSLVVNEVNEFDVLTFYVGSSRHDSDFLLGSNISDGTLRALAILAAIFQDSSNISLIGIEEPESGLHPAAAGLLLHAFQNASSRTQIVVTSHSADLLDDKSVSPESILVVTSVNGDTQIGPLDKVGRSILRDHLFSAGELLRQDQLKPEIPTPKFNRIRVQRHKVLKIGELERQIDAAARQMPPHRVRSASSV